MFNHDVEKEEKQLRPPKCVAVPTLLARTALVKAMLWLLWLA